MSDAKNKETDREKDIDKLIERIQQLIFQNYLMIFNLSGVKNAIKKGNDEFLFSNEYETNRQVNHIFSLMAKGIDALIRNGVKKEWKKNQSLSWECMPLTTSHDRKLRDYIREKATQSTRNKTADAFCNEKRHGFTLSERIWNLSGNAKKEIEVILQNGIKEGKGAAEIARSIKGYLKEPERLFRRVRNSKTGELEWSKAAKSYHPGQGKYRSAYKNALRLARTEIKAAQCEAAWLSAQNNPLITGWKIVLSNNHTTLKNGKPVPFRDICDELVGEYPKSFKFRGWHPQCRCEMLPILATAAERKTLYENIFADKNTTWEPKQIEKLPKGFWDWINKNKDRAKQWRNLPDFIKENFDNRELSNRFNYSTNADPNQKKNNKIDVQDLSDNTKVTSIMSEIVQIMKNEKVEYKEVKLLPKELTNSEIISRVGGGDLTQGSCASLALTYAGNRHGFDVLDFRGGYSRALLTSSKLWAMLAEEVGGKVIIGYNDFDMAKQLLKTTVKEKEYILAIGKHAAIVRKVGGGIEYLELQSSKNNGFKKLNVNALKQRFGCLRSHTMYGQTHLASGLIIDIDLLQKDNEYRIVLGYVNTSEDEQCKGEWGSIK